VSQDPDAVAAPAQTLASRPRTALAVAGLASFALGLPLARVLADSPEFFIAHGFGATETIAFWAVALVLVPAMAAGLAVVPLPGGRTLRWPVAAAFGALAAAGALQPLSGRATPFWLGTIAGALLVAHHLGRSRSFTDILAVASIGCVLLSAWVLGPSRTGTYVRAGRADAVRVEATDPAPVVVLVFDEFPVTAMLDTDLEINPERFPNVAALAGTSDWYRLASTVSPSSAIAVPSLLSGTDPRPGTVPVASEHPSNLFLQLARTHEVHAFESLTALCPPSVCDGGAVDEEPDEQRPQIDAAKGADLGGLVDDLSVVLRRALGSEALRQELPVVEGGWSGFAEGDEADIVDGSVRELVFDASTFDRETQEMLAVAGQEARSDQPLALVAHASAPHAPWIALPGGGRYPPTAMPGSEVVDGALHWTGDEASRRAGYQRMLLQIGAADEVLGRARAALERSGIWDDAVVVVTADHGTQFEGGYWRDARRGGAEVTGVPLFIKRPNQRSGSIDDRAVLLTDVLPTVLGLAGVRSPSAFDGLDLESDEVPARRTDAFVASPSDLITPDQRLEALEEVVARHRRWIDPDGGWDLAYQPGIDRPLVGRPVADLGVAAGSGGSWQRADGEAGRQLTVTLSGPAAEGGEPIVVACGTTIAAVVPADSIDDGSATAFLRADCPAAEVRLGRSTSAGLQTMELLP
jgi:hypothetical protein